MPWNRRVTTQDISWFLDLERNGQLNMNPDYQRRSVWSPGDRRFFLDTIFRGYPSPSIFLHKEIRDGKTVYAVVDGKQRLETILRFVQNKLAVAKEFGDARLDGKKWKDIQGDSDLAHAFWDYVVPVEFISFEEGTSLVNEVFDRLNRNSRKLVEQELRHAKYDGWFVDFVEREAVHEQDWKTLGVVTTSRAKRMKDVQFLSELLVLVLKGDIGGFDQTELDEFYAKYAEPLASDSEVEFEEDYVRDTWSAARKFLVAMEAANGCMAAFGRSFKHLYSIWAVIVLNLGKDADPNAVADKYRNFMAEAEKFKDQAYLDAMMQNEAGAAAMNPLTSLALKYFQNSTGASTEGPQRRARHEALTAALVGAPPP